MMFFCFSTPSIASPLDVPLKEKILHMDLNGSLIIMGSTICFVLAMHWAGVSETWNSTHVVGSLCGSAALLLLFILNELKMGGKAMIQGHLLKQMSIVANLVFMFFLSGLYFSPLYSLPIQFQTLDNDSASQSGVRLIPLVLGISVFTMVANTLLTMRPYYLPFLVLGAGSGTAGATLIYRLDANASSAKWIGYEILIAIGIGHSLQIPMIANQAVVTADDIAAVTSVTLFVETIGQAMFVAAFTNRLVSSLAQNVPSLDPLAVVNAGATQIREDFNPAEVQGILLSYLEGCKVSHGVSVACGGLAIVVSLAMATPVGVGKLQSRLRKPHLT